MGRIGTKNSPIKREKVIPSNTMENNLLSFHKELESWNEVTNSMHGNRMFDSYTGSSQDNRKKHITNYQIRIYKMGMNEMVEKETEDKDAKNWHMELHCSEEAIVEKKMMKMVWCLHIHIHRSPSVGFITMANLLKGLSSKTTVHSWSEVMSACGTVDSDSKLNWKILYKPTPNLLTESSSSIWKNIILLNERLTTLEKKMMTSPDETVKTLEDNLEKSDEGVKMLEDKVTSSSMQNNIILLNEKVKNWRIRWILSS